MKKYNVELVYTPVSPEFPWQTAEELKRENPMVNKPELVAEYMSDAIDASPEVESFWVILLNRKNRALGRHLVTKGTATSALAHPREVFRAAIMASATAIICVHNHPSGDPCPSAADVQITRQLREAAKAVGIDLLDHVIIGEAQADPMGRGYYSFREAGLI